MVSFNKDLFISYAHIDNQPLTPGQQGWISRFHASLEALLSMRLGHTAKIWRDDKLQGNDVYADEIVSQFTQTAVLVSILTPRYLNSDWCTKEAREFCESAAQSGGVIVDNRARIFKVLKSPVDTQESLPALFKNTLGYEFFTMEDGAPLELDPAYGEKFAQDYNRKVGKLAWDIAQLLKQLATVDVTCTNGCGCSCAIPKTIAAKPTVYLAECSYDQKEIREILEGDLRRHGYTVLPDQQLPRDEADYVATVEHLLARSAVAIHLVGAGYGSVPDGPSQKSVVVLQNEVAAKKCKRGTLARLIWLPEGTRSKQAPQQAFIEALHQNAEAQFGADLITGDLETLKTSIYSILKKLEQPRPHATEKQSNVEGENKLIYLNCTDKDRKATVPIRKYFREWGYDVALPAFEGDATTVRDTHRQLMSTCDAVILFYGAGDEAWKRTLDSELKKIRSYRDGKPLLACGTYLAAPMTPDKEDLVDMAEPHLINGLVGFPESQMADFVPILQSTGVTG
jgi:hypothetical protein